MFHCNGWCMPWSLSAVAGTHVCLRWVRAAAIFDALAKHGVTHLCGAPIVMSTLINAAPEERKSFPQKVRFMAAAAPPPESVLAAMAEAGFEVVHVYGLTEVYGPAVVNEWHEEWDALDAGGRAARKARQGVRYAPLEELAVLDPKTLKPVPADGKTIGEVMFRGNIVMRGYLKNPKATREALKGGWFHSGDLGVMYPDGYIQLKDRSKDIIISGGENISSIEVEDAIARHPGVLFVAVVARPDAKWGEHPCAFVELRAGVAVTRRGNHRVRPLAACQIQAAAHGRLFRTAQDIDGQDPEIRSARTGEGLVTIPRGRRRPAPASRGRGGSVDGCSQPLELVLDSEFLLFQCGDPHFIPIGVGHFGLDDVLDFFMLVGQVKDMSLQRHACTSSLDFGRLARALKASRLAKKVNHQTPSLSSPKKV